MVWQVVVQVREGNFVFCSDWLTNDDFVDVIELVPVFISAGETQELMYMQNKSSELIVDVTELCFHFVLKGQLWKIGSLNKSFAK